MYKSEIQTRVQYRGMNLRVSNLEIFNGLGLNDITKGISGLEARSKD